MGARRALPRGARAFDVAEKRSYSLIEGWRRARVSTAERDAKEFGARGRRDVAVEGLSYDGVLTNDARLREETSVVELLVDADKVGVVGGAGLRGEHGLEHELLGKSLKDVEVDHLGLRALFAQHGLEEEVEGVSGENVGVGAAEVALRSGDDAVGVVGAVGAAATTAAVRARHDAALKLPRAIAETNDGEWIVRICGRVTIDEFCD